jgi:hypothetical protein
MKESSRAAAAAPHANDNAAVRPGFSIGDHVLANDQAPGDYRRRNGIITEIGPGTLEFRVEFEDGRQPTTGYLQSEWLYRMNRSRGL